VAPQLATISIPRIVAPQLATTRHNRSRHNSPQLATINEYYRSAEIKYTIHDSNLLKLKNYKCTRRCRPTGGITRTCFVQCQRCIFDITNAYKLVVMALFQSFHQSQTRHVHVLLFEVVHSSEVAANLEARERLHRHELESDSILVEMTNVCLSVGYVLNSKFDRRPTKQGATGCRWRRAQGTITVTPIQRAREPPSEAARQSPSDAARQPLSEAARQPLREAVIE
jgi:hypothetical protein